MFNKLFLLVVTLFLFTVTGYSQSIQLVMNPSPSPYLSDWQNRTETATLIINNTSGSDISVKLKTELFDSKGSLVASTNATRMPVLVVPVGTSQYKAEDIFPYSAIDFKGNVERTSMKTGRMSEDNYKICVALTDLKGNPVGTSGTVCRFFNIISCQPPVLLNPRENEVIPEASAKGIVFRWTPVTPAPKLVVSYLLRVWEVMEGQDYMTAFRTNQPVIEKEIRGALQVQWPVDMAVPEPGKKYVWTITAKVDDQDNDCDGSTDEPDAFSIAAACSCNAPLNLTVNYYPDGSLNNPEELTVNCEGKIEILKGCRINPVIQEFDCTKGCLGDVRFDLINTTKGINVLIGVKAEEVFKNTLTDNSIYRLTAHYQCRNTQGGADCNECSVYFNTGSRSCECDIWDKLNYKKNNNINNQNAPITLTTCGSTIEAQSTDAFLFNINHYCSDESCATITSTTIYYPNGSVYSSNPGITGIFFNQNQIILPAGTYTIVFNASCENIVCEACTLYIHVNPMICECGDWSRLGYQKNEENTVFIECGTTLQSSLTDDFIFSVGHGCLPNNCGTVLSSTIYNPDWTIYQTFPFIEDVPFNANSGMPCGIYKIAFKAICGGVICDSCMVYIQLNSGIIQVYDSFGNFMPPDEIPLCLNPGKYKFKVAPPLSNGTMVNFSYSIQPHNIIISGSFPYSDNGQIIFLPYYSCITTPNPHFTLSYTWQNQTCSSSIGFDICQADSCCTFVEDSLTRIMRDKKTKNLVFISDFIVHYPQATLTKIKVQILEISLNDIPLNNSNIYSIEKLLPLPAFTVFANSTHAVTDYGNGIWFANPILPPFTGKLSFKGKILDVFNNQPLGCIVKLKLRFTFYKAAGGGCPEEICEKDIYIKKKL